MIYSILSSSVPLCLSSFKFWLEKEGNLPILFNTYKFHQDFWLSLEEYFQVPDLVMINDLAGIDDWALLALSWVKGLDEGKCSSSEEGQSVVSNN